MNLTALPEVFECLPAWGRLFVQRRDLYTVPRRRRLLSFIAEDLLEMTPEESREFEARALPRIAFASPETFALRVIQSLAEVCH